MVKSNLGDNPSVPTDDFLVFKLARDSATQDILTLLDGTWVVHEVFHRKF